MTGNFLQVVCRKGIICVSPPLRIGLLVTAFLLSACSDRAVIPGGSATAGSSNQRAADLASRPEFCKAGTVCGGGGGNPGDPGSAANPPYSPPSNAIGEPPSMNWPDQAGPNHPRSCYTAQSCCAMLGEADPGCPVPIQPPAYNVACDGSPYTIGGDLFSSTPTGYGGSNGTTIDDVFSFLPSGNDNTADGWLYTTVEGNYFIQWNTTAPGPNQFFTQALQGVPFAGPAISNIVDGIFRANGQPISSFR